MSGGYKQINGNDGNLYSKENQPKNKRTSNKPITDLLKKHLKRKPEIIIQGIDIVTGLTTKIRVQMPTLEIIVAALCRNAAKGDNQAINIIYDRIEQKVSQPIDFGDGATTIHINGKPPDAED